MVECKFFNTSQGCRKGDKCAFEHNTPETKLPRRGDGKRPPRRKKVDDPKQPNRRGKHAGRLKGAPKANLASDPQEPQAPAPVSECIQAALKKIEAQYGRVVFKPRDAVSVPLDFVWAKEVAALEKLFAWKFLGNEKFGAKIFPSDPDIPSDRFPHGIYFHVSVPVAYQAAGQAASELPAIEIPTPGESRVSEFLAQALRLKFDETVRQGKPDRPIFNALKMLDFELAEFLQLERISSVQVVKKSPPAPPPKLEWGAWTPEEQQRLEEALVTCAKVANVKDKWEQIANCVATKSDRECWERFKACREAARLEKEYLEKLENGEIDLESSSGESGEPDIQVGTDHDDESHGDDGDDDKIVDNHSHKVVDNHGQRPPGGQTIYFREPEIEGLGVVRFSLLKFTLSCGRCGRRAEGQTEPSATAPVNGMLICTNCKGGIQFTFWSDFAHSSSSQLGKFVVFGGTIDEVLPSDYLGSCLNCMANVKFVAVFPGVKKTSLCRHCHHKCGLRFSSLRVDGFQHLASEVLARPPTDKRPKKERLNLTIGQPLPKNGTCQHYKKSYRWFRFQCCGRTFPCDTCHDAVSDHECQLASRMICGLCSREQPASNKSCVCGSTITAARSSHWEGGKGCRDARAMSRRDDKKYKLLHRQQMEAAKEAAKRKAAKK